MRLTAVLLGSLLGFYLQAQHETHHQHTTTDDLPIITHVEPQPLIAQAFRIGKALDFVGNALPADVFDQLLAIREQAHTQQSVIQIQKILDPFCLAMVDINPESRVKVTAGSAIPKLIQDGWTTFLVKVHNQANITAVLAVESPNAKPVLHQSTGAHRMDTLNYLSPGDLDNQFVEVAIYQGRPLSNRLSGLEVEYFLMQVYTRAVGMREVELGFNVGQGTQDIGFRNTIDLLFDIEKSIKVIFDVLDFDGTPTMASFIFSDGKDRYQDVSQVDYRLVKAQSTHWMEGQKEKTILPAKPELAGIYPLPARRLAAKDEYPDFFFQPQIYRSSGEHIFLPPGTYQVTYGRGPEYLEQFREVVIPSDIDSMSLTFHLERWIHMADLRWYSADHHIHAAGCSHYESPVEGVLPEHMWRQVLGEDLNMGNNLSWGPSWYFQKQYFTGRNHALSNNNNILRYDVEVSGFPSSHAGHVVLLNLTEDDYPGTTLIEEWPSWTLPVLKWAKDQDGITGYAHSGWGLAPVEPTIQVPNYQLPKMDGIGANEYVVTVTHDVVDFYSAGDTPWPAELNMWYHTLNCGFTTRISGETDFPCISDERVGRARIYAHLGEGLDFNQYMDALVQGNSYVSTGHSHLIDLQVDDVHLRQGIPYLDLEKPKQISVKLRAAAYLPLVQDEVGKLIQRSDLYQSPYWHIERSRKGTSREVDVELIINGQMAARQSITADGEWNDLSFSYDLTRSSWVAARVFGSAHTNPIFIEVGDKPIRIRESAQWCRAAVDQCWQMKHTRIRDSERSAAGQAYDHARKIYDSMLQD